MTDTTLLTDEQCEDLKTLVALEKANKIIDDQRKRIERLLSMLEDYAEASTALRKELERARRAMK